jgi:hypothetical protein
VSNDLWSIICLAGLAGWIVSALVLAFRAFPGKGEFAGRPALKWGIALIVSYAVWIAGLLHA